MYIGNCLKSQSLCACGFLLLQFNIRTLNAVLNPICHLLALLGAHHILHISRIRVKPFNTVFLVYWDHKMVKCVMQHHLWSPQTDLQFPVVTPKHGTIWCNAHNLCSSHTSNNFSNSHSCNTMASTTHTQRMLEIDLRVHGYQTRHAENYRHSLYVGKQHPSC